MGAVAVGRVLASCLVVIPLAVAAGGGVAQAKNGDTHINGIGVERTLDCNDSTLHVMGSGHRITALGSCWAVTVQGSGNIVVADNVVNDITVYGWDQTVFFKNGEPVLWDRGRELGMTNRLSRVPA
ncbi:DUF3060 domain-containing protein [Mycobacterium manitobense]|uniref:DUF3060 domain-containing protein n=1 Tax=[Mycobacterium] manitobense TaxID=190147 RepID=A0A9X3BTB4_9MYCO|nr:DUF3060 domain-containing protein [[Mycobacterium] manitobense]MCV7169458.1 DUF3060 domain-containing protein [[Mycobacterium] manitobense]